MTNQSDAPQPATNEADELLTALNLDPDTYRTDGGWLNIPKIKAAIASPENYPHIAQPASQAVMQAAQDVLDRWNSPTWEWHKQGPTADLMHALQKALAQPAVQPTERNFCGRCGKRMGDIDSIHTCTPPAAVQPAEPWIGLTPEEIEKYFKDEWYAYESYRGCFEEVMRWQEAKLKEKNT